MSTIFYCRKFTVWIFASRLARANRRIANGLIAAVTQFSPDLSAGTKKATLQKHFAMRPHAARRSRPSKKVKKAQKSRLCSLPATASPSRLLFGIITNPYTSCDV